MVSLLATPYTFILTIRVGCGWKSPFKTSPRTHVVDVSASFLGLEALKVREELGDLSLQSTIIDRQSVKGEISRRLGSS
jgi:hypothetical protein